MKKIFFLLSLIPGLLAALPENPQIQAGDVAVVQGLQSCQITQKGSQALINWENFSIGAGETVQFIHLTKENLVF